MNQLQKKNLELIVNKLRDLPPDRFDFKVFVGEDWQGNPNLSCGTKACALGWACTIPELAAQGLTLVPDGDPHNGIPVCADIITYYDPENISTWKSINDMAMKLFGLSNHEVDELFVPDFHDSPRGDASALEVADHIEKFIAQKVLLGHVTTE